MRFVWVGIGGAAGSMMRYAIGLAVGERRFPWATLGINVSGAFVLAVFLTLSSGRLSATASTPVAVGVLGGFTTFSTFAWEGLTISRDGRPQAALIYVAASVVGGLIAAWGGYSLGRTFR